MKKIKTQLISSKRLESRYSDWHDLLSGCIVTADQLSAFLPVDRQEIKEVIMRYPMRINPYYLSLIGEKNDPIWKQAIPDIMEIDYPEGAKDPLDEEVQSPCPNLIHRYPDRVLFMVSNTCAMYCRFCLRKRKVGRPFVVTDDTIDEGIEYVKRTPSIREVILSGGDPFLMEDTAIENLLKRIRRASHVEVIRIHTRVPCALPQRITDSLAAVIGKFHPIFINTHFNHPDEITSEAAHACGILADAGIPLGCQTVLLRGVNDDPKTMKQLLQKLIKIRVRPYYIHHSDPVKGTCHFRTSISCGLNLMRMLRGHISGLCVPQYMVDLPGGGGKVPLLPEYVRGVKDGKIEIENFQGTGFIYLDLDENPVG